MDSNQQLIDLLVHHMDQRFDALNKRVDTIESKLENLNAFRWKIIGGSMAMSFAITAIVNLIQIFLSTGG